MASVCSPSAVETQQQIHADGNQFKHLHRSRLRRQRRAGQRAVSMVTVGIDRRSTDRLEDVLQTAAC